MTSKLWLPRRTYRYVSRYLEIAHVLAKYGFSDLVAAIRLDRYLPFKKKLVREGKDPRLASLSRWERVRLALEELGPTFIKFGQIMSNRPDLMPEDLILELKKLQESVPAFPGEAAKQLVEQELGRPIESAFSDFSIAPIAAASISQVHRATLPSGESVAVKVQRPNIEQVIKTDLEILFHLASLAQRHIDGMEMIDPVAVVKEFERSITQELNFTIEASHIETFSRNFSGDETVYVPRVYVDYTTKRVLTMEFIDGIRPSNRETLVQAGLDPKVIAARGADSILKQVFEHGFFHADPHPGNMRILEGNIICFLDFGMMGFLLPRDRKHLGDILIGLANQDAPRISRTLTHMSRGKRPENPEQLEYDIYMLLERYSYRSLREIDLLESLNELVSLVTDHKLYVAADFYLLAKALMIIEGVGRDLDPDFDFVEHATPFAKRLIKERLSLPDLAKDVYLSLTDLALLLRDLPADTRDLIDQAKQGKLRVVFEHKGLEPMLKTHEQISNRISFSIVLSALIVGSALIMRADIPPKVYGVPIIGALGFLTAGLMGFWLLVSILSHGKM